MYYNSKTSVCQEFMYNFLLSNNGVLSVLEEEAGGGGGRHIYTGGLLCLKTHETDWIIIIQCFSSALPAS